MKYRRAFWWLPLLASAFALAQLQCLLTPNDTETGARVPNQRPTVRITAGAASPDPRGIDYKVQFQWSGADNDGVVSLYRWAIDDTVSEGAWHDTTGFSATIKFFATSEREQYRHELSDWHTFYIRAIDNEFFMSPAEKRYFNAFTIAPVTKITKPKLSGQTTLQRTFLVRWEGEDLDSSRPDKKPLWFEYKLVRVLDFADSNAIRHALLTDDNIFLDTLRVGSKAGWVRVPSTVQSAELRDLPPSGIDNVQSYVFAVRAIDEANATEPDLDSGRNYIMFNVSQTPSQPIVTVSENSLGSHKFPSEGEVWDNVTVFVGRDYRFKWVGDASGYGSEAGNVNYGLDIPDPEDETLQDVNGIGGWVGWGTWQGNQVPFSFTKDQANTYHILYVYMRDVSNTEQSTRKCRIRLHVVDFTFSRFALLVDDAYLSEGIRDPIHDDFMKSTILRQLYQYGTVDEWSSFSPGDINTNADRLPDDLLVQYQHIIWSLNYDGGRSSGLYKTEVLGNRGITSFLTAGGRLFIVGQPLVAALMNRSTIYPMKPPAEEDFREREKLYFQYLYVRNTLEGPGSGYQGDACAQETGGIVLARSLHPNYPDLPLDRTKWDPEKQNAFDPTKLKGGLSKFEGFHLGTSGDRIVPLAGLDSLYQVRTWNRSTSTACRDRVGPGDGTICAWRYHSTHADTLAQRQHGRVLVFDFQPYYFQADRLTDAGISAINWLVTGKDR